MFKDKEVYLFPSSKILIIFGLPFCKHIFSLFFRLPERKVLKSEIDKNKKCLFVGNFGIMSVVVLVVLCLQPI